MDKTPGPTYPWGSPHPVCSKIPRLRTGTSHISPIASILPHYIAISKPLKPNLTWVHLLGSWQDTRAYLPMGLTTPCMLENSQAAHLNFAYIPVYSIPITGYWAHYIAIFKPLKPNPTGVHLLGSWQDTRAYLPMGLTTPCMLENTQAAHLNFAYIPVYSIPITGYRAPLHRHF